MGRPKLSLEQRRKNVFGNFMRLVDVTGGPDACWLWLGARWGGRIDYGHFCWLDKHITAHRAAWKLFRGEIPAGLEVCHNCPGGDTPLCCNPKHLWLGTHQENEEDKATERHLWAQTLKPLMCVRLGKWLSIVLILVWLRSMVLRLA
jgi:hypothetical protein